MAAPDACDASPCPIYFVMDHRIFKMPVLGWLFKLAKAIPIAPRSEDPAPYEAAFEAAAITGVLKVDRAEDSGQTAPPSKKYRIKIPKEYIFCHCIDFSAAQDLTHLH